MPFAATWMDLKIIILSEVSQKEKNKYHVVSLICGIYKMLQMNLFTKQKQSHRQRKQIYGYQMVNGGGVDWEFGINRYTLLYIKQINNKDLLYSTGNYIQDLVITYNKKESEKE